MPGRLVGSLLVGGNTFPLESLPARCPNLIISDVKARRIWHCTQKCAAHRQGRSLAQRERFLLPWQYRLFAGGHDHVGVTARVRVAVAESELALGLGGEKALQVGRVALSGRPESRRPVESSKSFL